MRAKNEVAPVVVCVISAKPDPYFRWREVMAEDIGRVEHYNSASNGTKWQQVKHSSDES